MNILLIENKGPENCCTTILSEQILSRDLSFSTSIFSNCFANGFALIDIFEIKVVKFGSRGVHCAGCTVHCTGVRIIGFGSFTLDLLHTVQCTSGPSNERHRRTAKFTVP